MGITTVVRTISSQFKSLKVRKFPIQNPDLYANEPGAKNPSLWEQCEQFKDQGLLPSAQHRLHQPRWRWQCPDAGGVSSATYRQESIGARASLSRNWSNADLWTHRRFLNNSWSWVLVKWPVTLFYRHINRKKETTHSGSSRCLRPRDAPAPGKGKSHIRIHSGHAAMIHHMHTYLQKRKKWINQCKRKMYGEQPVFLLFQP